MPINFTPSFNLTYYYLAIKNNSGHILYFSTVPESATSVDVECDCGFEDVGYEFTSTYPPVTFNSSNIDTILNTNVIENDDLYTVRHIISRAKKTQSEYLKALQRDVKNNLLSKKAYTGLYNACENYDILYVIEVKEELKDSYQINFMEF